MFQATEKAAVGGPAASSLGKAPAAQRTVAGARVGESSCRGAPTAPSAFLPVAVALPSVTAVATNAKVKHFGTTLVPKTTGFVGVFFSLLIVRGFSSVTFWE